MKVLVQMIISKICLQMFTGKKDPGVYCVQCFSIVYIMDTVYDLHTDVGMMLWGAFAPRYFPGNAEF